MNADSGVYGRRRSRSFVGHGESELLFDRGEIPVHRAFEAQFLENRGMKSLGKTANTIEGGLCDFPDLAQICTQRRSLGSVIAGSPEHRSDRRQNLTELVVELP